MLDSPSDDDSIDDQILCIYCGLKVNEEKAWSHIDGDANLGVKKIEYFCSEEHKAEYFRS